MKRTTLTSSKQDVTEEARIQKMRSIVQFFGKGLWKGDLIEMREDQSRHRTQSKKTGKDTQLKRASEK